MDVLQPLSIATVHASTALIYKNATLPPIQMVSPTNLSMNTMFTENTTKWHATECSIQPIIHSFNATVTNNIYNETTIATWETSWATWDQDLNISDSELQKIPAGMYFNPPWGLEQGITPNTSFMFSDLAASSLDTFFQDLFTGVWFMRSMYSSSFIPSSLNMYAAPDFIQAMAIGNITGCDVGSMDKLQCAMENVAAAVTKSFRDSVFIADSDPVRASMAVGRAMASVIYVEVRWQWIVLPGLVWVLGAVTLVGSMWKSRGVRAPKWRNDPVPLLFLFRGRGEDAVGVAEREVEEKAEGLRVRLYESNGRMALG